MTHVFFKRSSLEMIVLVRKEKINIDRDVQTIHGKKDCTMK